MQQDRQTRALRILEMADRAMASRNYRQALGGYDQVLRLGFESDAIHVNTAQCLKRSGDLDGAFRHFDRAFLLRRRAPRDNAPPAAVAHLADQISWLRGQGREDLPARATPRLAAACPFRADPEIPAVLLNPEMAVERIALSAVPGDCFYVFDNVLAPAALDALLEQLLASAIWFDTREERGYFGAHLHDGLATPFVLALAKALHGLVAAHAGPVLVAQLWAFRYLQESQGIDIHADQGDWNLNLWPVDDRHLTAGAGGMTLWDLKIGADIPFADYNARPDLNRSRIEAAGAAAHAVPYRGNRAVLFPSKYLHRTDPGRFGGSFEGRRINVTMMTDLPR